MKSFLILFLFIFSINVSSYAQNADTNKIHISLDRFQNEFDFEGDCAYNAFTDATGQVRYVITDRKYAMPPLKMNDYIHAEIKRLKFPNLPNSVLKIKLCIRKTGGTSSPSSNTNRT